MKYPFYTFCFRLLLPFIVLRLWIKSFKEPLYCRHLKERFGKIKPHKAHPIWIHGVSVGEIQAAFSLIEHYHKAGQPLLVTTTTAGGRETADRLYHTMATVAYLPYDDPIFIERFLNGYQPKIALIMETELWPNLLDVTKRHTIPVWIINARLSPRSLKRYHQILSFTRKMLSDLTGIITQSKADTKRFESLGGSCPIWLGGNLKFDRMPTSESIQLGQQWRQNIGDRPVIVFASTREGEEALVLNALPHVLSKGFFPIIIPRHPARFDAVAQLIENSHYSCIRRSKGDFKNIIADSVGLGDSLGEMTAYYELSNVVIMGGSWLPYGGQNPLEALSVEKPVLVGPHMAHFSDIVNDGIEMKAITQCSNIDSAIKLAIHIIEDPQLIEHYTCAAGEFLTLHRGALSKILGILEAHSPLNA